MLPQREQQALREIGQTAISSPLAWCLALVFLLTIVSVPLMEPLSREPGRGGEDATSAIRTASPGPWHEFAGAVGGSLRAVEDRGLRQANHQLLAAMEGFEARLEDESFLRRLVLPVVQGLLTRVFGVGNEEVYPGRHDWLFYRPDIDYVTGRGFLDEPVLRARVLQSDPWTDPPRPDPVPALVELQEELESRGVDLLLLPTPVKPVLEPEFFSRRYAQGPRPIQNPSYELFCRRLVEAGIELFDVAESLSLEAGAKSDPLFLRVDSHWTPAAVEQVARSVGLRLDALGWTPPSVPGRFFQRRIEVENLGDIAQMLSPTLAQTERWQQRVTSHRIVDGAGRPWRSDPRAEILLLGDSFSNIYSDPGLGWGVGAGLAEQLSFFLQAPVDKIALNAGGALATRKALQRQWQGASGRLQDKRIVIYQFAVRELAQGDWRLLGVD
jgi:hypothetical protein